MIAERLGVQEQAIIRVLEGKSWRYFTGIKKGGKLPETNCDPTVKCPHCDGTGMSPWMVPIKNA